MGNKISAQQEEQIKLAFDHFDQDRNGELKVDELITALRIKRADALRLLGECDIDNNGAISYKEFLKIIEKKIAPVYMTLLEGSKDKDVTLENMKRVYKKADVEVTDKELEDYFNSIDTNKNNVISLDEFIIGCFVDLAIKNKGPIKK